MKVQPTKEVYGVEDRATQSPGTPEGEATADTTDFEAALQAALDHGNTEVRPDPQLPELIDLLLNS